LVITPPKVSTPSERGVAQHTGLDSRTHRYHFVWVNALVRLFAEEFFDGFYDSGHSGLATDKNYFIDLIWLKSRVVQTFLHWTQRFFN